MTVPAWKLAAAAAAVCAVAAGVWGLAPQAPPPATPDPQAKPAAAPKPPPAGDTPAKKDGPARIKAGDRLFITSANVYTDEPVKGVYLVEPDGTVFLGLAYGRVRVAGLTPGEAEGRLREPLLKVFKDPRFWVTAYDPVVHGPLGLVDRLANLEKEVAELREAVEKLRKR